MRPILVALALALAAGAARAQSWEPKEQFRKKLAAAERRAAKAHAALGKFANGERLFLAGRNEYLRAVELDPSNEEAEAELGRTLVGGQWVTDPHWPVHAVNDRPADEQAEVLGRFRAKRRIAGKEMAADFEELADFAADRKLDVEARAMWEAMLRYEPDNARALAKLGWRKVDGVMVSSAEADSREARSKHVAEMPGGRVMEATSDVEEKTDQKFSKRRSAHFYFEGQYTDGEMRALVRVAEATRAEFVEAFQVPMETEPEFLSGVFLRHEGDHTLFLEKCTSAGPLERKAALELSTWQEFEPNRVAIWLGSRPFEDLRDETVHAVALYAFHDLTKMEKTPPWLAEGVAAWLGDRVLGTALSCFPRGEMQQLRDARTTLRWRRLLRDQVREGTAPAIHEVTHAAPGEMTFEMTLKAWSIVDWLMTDKRGRLYDFLARCRTGSSGKALRRALGAKDDDAVDEMWNAWIQEQH